MYKKTVFTLLFSIGFLFMSCGGDTDATTNETNTDSTEVTHNCDPECDKNKKCGDECKKHCENPENCKHGEAVDTTTDEEHACEVGGCAPGACGAGE